MTRPSAAQADQSSGSTEAAGPSEAEQRRPEAAPRAASRPEERRSVVTRSPEGDPATGVALDAAFVFAGVLCVEGWFFGGDGLEISLDAAGPATAHTMMFERPDVTAGFKLTQARARGFVAVYTSESAIDHIRVRIAGAPESDAALIAVKRRERAEVVAFVEQKQWLAGFLFKHTVKSSEWTSIVAPRVGAAPESFKKARAYIEQAKAASEIGGLVVGWAVCEPSCELVAVCDGGSSCGLQDAVRWTRDDIIKVFGGEFGAFTADAGFLLALHGDPSPAAQVRVIAIYGDTAYSLAASAWTIVPADPASFTRWSFTLPTEAQDFQRRLEQHDGPIIHKLIQQKNRSIAQLKSQRLDFGLPIDNPICSLSIPLYGRYDFMLHQMLEMSDDLFIREKVEIIYVVDDPRIREAVIKESHELHRRFGLSFSVVVSGINRGFSAATNLGVARSSGAYVVLMNSDVIPIRPGWLEAMIRVLETNPGVGAVGPRLLYPNGTVQHDGMDFEWEPAFAAHLNQHPGMGRLPSPVSPAAVTRKAITGACMMLRRGVYDGVGRLDDTFLIGDFEDSDLCLKIREAGMEVALVQDVLLVHLERQSFRDIGADLFRERVVRYNAWRHEQRWRKKITELRSFASRRLG